MNQTNSVSYSTSTFSILSMLSIILMVFIFDFQQSSAVVKLNVNEYPKPIDCGPPSEMTSFSLHSPPDLKHAFDAQAMTLPFVGNFGLSFAEESVLTGIRIDVCWNPEDNNVILQRIVKRNPTAGFAFSFFTDQIIPDQMKPDPELKKLLFGEPNTNLELAFLNQTIPKKSYLLKSHQSVNGQTLVTLSNYDGETKKILQPPMDGTYPGSVRVGQVFPGDPWAIKQMTPVHKLFEVNADGEKIKIKLDFAFRGQVGSYLSYKLNSVQVEDAHGGPAAGPLKNECVVFGNDPSPCWTTNLTHHGLFDTFELNFENVSYVIGDHQIKIIRKVNNEVKNTKVIPVDNCDSLSVCGKDI